MRKTINFWFQNTRWVSIPQSLLPALVAYAAASIYANQKFMPLGLLAIIGGVLLHLGMNLFDDYFDYKKSPDQIRERLASEGIRARVAKCSYLSSGETTPRALFWVATAFCVAALIPAIVIFANRDMFLIYWAIASAVFAIQYSAPPLRWSYYGLGELAIGVIFGPLLMVGVFVSAAGEYDPAIWFLSIPMGLLVANVVYVHSVLDMAADKQLGKQTLAVIIGSPKKALLVNYVLIFGPMLMIAIAVAINVLSPWFLCVLILLPMAIGLMNLMTRFVKNPKEDIKPQRWMGPMQQWNLIQEAGIEWFMIRWFTARNYLTFFGLILIIVAFCI